MENTVTCLMVVISEFYFCSPWHTCAYVSLCLLSPKIVFLFQLFELNLNLAYKQQALEKSVDFLKWISSWHWHFSVLPHGLAAIIRFCKNLLLRLVGPDRRMYFLWLVSRLFFVLVAVKQSKSLVLFWLWGIPDQFYHFSASSHSWGQRDIPSPSPLSSSTSPEPPKLSKLSGGKYVLLPAFKWLNWYK